MKLKSAKRAVAGLSAALCMAVSTWAGADPLAPYVGAGVGQADVRSDQIVSGSALRFDEHHSAWKLVAGIRPLSLFGAEIAYIDFGKPSAANGGTTAAVHQKATAAFALIGLPVPLPLLDIYGKAGLAWLQTHVNASNGFGLDRNDSNFAYGVGVGLKLPVVTLRAEYERISASGGDPDLMSIGVLWRF